MFKLIVLSSFLAFVAAQLPGFGAGFGRLDPVSAREFQERNGLPEDPNSVYPAQALLRPSNLMPGPAYNRIATPITEEGAEGPVSQYAFPPRGAPVRSGGYPPFGGLNSLVFG